MVVNPNKSAGDKRRYVAEHVLIWEAANGPLPEGWDVHHINGIIENLLGMSASKHHSNKKDYQARIRELEAELEKLRQTNSPAPAGHDGRLETRFDREKVYK